MPEIPQDVELRLLRRWCLDDIDAVTLVAALFQASQAADDVIDKGGGPEALADMSRLLMIYFGEILPNAFARRHADMIAGAALPAIANWAGATAWENDAKADHEKLVFAYVMRESLEGVLIAIAHKIGGPRHAQLVRNEFSEIYHFGPGREGLSSYIAEHGKGS
jgi:hypothetical protein